jgi:hypothetical protein
VTGGNDQKVECPVALGANETRTVQITVRVDANAPCNSMLTNVAHVNGWGSDQAQTRVVCAAPSPTVPVPATATVAVTATPTLTVTSTPIVTATATPVVTLTATPVATLTATPVLTATATPTITTTPVLTATATATPGAGQTATPTISPILPTVTPAGTPATTVTPPAVMTPFIIAGQDNSGWVAAGLMLLLGGAGIAFAAWRLRGI